MVKSMMKRIYKRRKKRWKKEKKKKHLDYIYIVHDDFFVRQIKKKIWSDFQPIYIAFSSSYILIL